MTESEIVRLIREEVRKQVDVILAGLSQNATESVEDIQQLFPGMPNITKRPVMHPYGFASRAVDGKVQVTAKMGEHPGNQMVLGHRDSDRPTDLQSGETAVYSSKHMQLRMGNTQIFLGKTTDNTASGFAGQDFIGVDENSGNIIMQHKSGASAQIDKNGSIIINSVDGSLVLLDATTNQASVVSKDGNVISLKPDGVLIADKSGKQMISMDGVGVIQVIADKDVIISGGRTTIQGGSIYLGEAAIYSAVLGENLVAYLDTVVAPAFVSLGILTFETASQWNAVPTQNFLSAYIKERSNIV